MKITDAVPYKMDIRNDGIMQELKDNSKFSDGAKQGNDFAIILTIFRVIAIVLGFLYVSGCPN